MQANDQRSICPLSRVLDLFGDKWSLLILRDAILFDKRHYGDFLASPEGISTNILANRLRQLEASGILEKYTDPLNAKSMLYIPTGRAVRLMPLMVEAMRWGVSEFGDEGVPDFAHELLRLGPEAFVDAKSRVLTRERQPLRLAG